MSNHILPNRQTFIYWQMIIRMNKKIIPVFVFFVNGTVLTEIILTLALQLRLISAHINVVNC